MRALFLLAAAFCLLGTGLRAEDQSPNVPAELQPLARKGKEQFMQGDYAGAEKTFGEILEKVPTNVYALSNLGVVLFRVEKFKEAEEMFKKAIAIAPGDGFSHCTLGIVYYSQGKFDDAVVELKKALEIDLKNAVAHNYLGITYSKKGLQEVARKELESAVALDAGYADAHFNLAVVLATQHPPDKANSRKYYQQSLKLGAERDTALEALIDGPDAEPAPAAGSAPPSAKSDARPGSPPELIPLAQKAKEQFEQEDYAGAEKAYRQILEKAPQNLQALSNLGVVLFRAGKMESAEEVLQQTSAMVPDDGFSHCTLGIVYYAEGKFENAILELNNALTIDHQNATARDYLAATYDEMHRQEREREKLDEGKVLPPP